MAEMRQVGFWEEMCKVYHENFRCSGMVHQSARVRGPLTAELIQDGLLFLQKRHPLLQVTFSEFDEAHSAFKFDSYEKSPNKKTLIPLTVIAKHGDEHWKQVVEEELNTDFKEGSPCLWRVTYIHDNSDEQIHDFVFIFHHSISDGTSNAYVVRDLLSYCSGETDSLKEMPLMPPAEKLIQSSQPSTDLDSDFVRNEDVGKMDLTNWSFEANAPIENRRTRVIYRELPAEIVTALREKGKTKGVSMNSLMTAAFILAGLKNDHVSKNVMFSSAISLRKSCVPPVGNDHFGCYVMVVNTTHEVREDKSFWTLAAESGVALKDAIGEKEKAGFMPDVFSKKDLKMGMVEGLGATNDAGFFPGGPVISNLGLLDFPENYGPFRLENLYFSTSQVSGNFHTCLWVLTLHGKLFCCFTYIEPLLSSVTAEKVVDLFVSTLENLNS